MFLLNYFVLDFVYLKKMQAPQVKNTDEIFIALFTLVLKGVFVYVNMLKGRQSGLFLIQKTATFCFVFIKNMRKYINYLNSNNTLFL